MQFITNSIWIGGFVLICAVGVHALFVTVDFVRAALWRGMRRAREAELLALRVDTARQRRDHESARGAWSGWRKFVIARKIIEAEGICSFYLAPHDKKPLPTFNPGQYLTFKLEIPGQSAPLVRCYSLSDCLRDGQYRISIKKLCAPKKDVPGGLASCFFHDQVNEGDIVDVRAPGGKFHFEPYEESAALAMIAGGIGITPLLCMLNGLLLEGPLRRQVHFFLGVRNSREHAFKEQLERLARENDKLRLHVCYSNPLPGDIQARDYHHAGHINLELLKKVLPSSNLLYYICGPPAMMESLMSALKQWSVPESHIRYEAFGPKSVAGVADKIGVAGGAGAPTAGAAAPGTDAIEVLFEKSGRSLRWTRTDGTLLDFAERNGIQIRSGCRAGNCGTCMVAIKSGQVTYQTRPGAEPEEGSCLTCCSVPAGKLVLNS
jgi:ferredoxin-NADP reductase